jgi:hypothetical protein
MRRILSGVIGYPHFGQRVLSDAITFSRLIFRFRGTGKSLPVLGSLRETVVAVPDLACLSLISAENMDTAVKRSIGATARVAGHLERFPGEPFLIADTGCKTAGSSQGRADDARQSEPFTARTSVATRDVVLTAVQ